MSNANESADVQQIEASMQTCVEDARNGSSDHLRPIFQADRAGNRFAVLGRDRLHHRHHAGTEWRSDLDCLSDPLPAKASINHHRSP